MTSGGDDPRVQRSKAAVLEATVELLADVGWAACTVERVAERSGVAKTTIYRHWPTRAQLVLDAFDSLIAPLEPPDTGTVRGDLLAQLTSLAEALESARWAGVIPALIEAGERDPEVAQRARDMARHRRDTLRRILGRGVERGEVPEGVDVDVTATMLGAPLFYRRFVSREPLDERFVEALVDGVLRASGCR